MLRNLSHPFTVVIRNNLRMHKHQILTMLSPDLVKFHARDGARRGDEVAYRRRSMQRRSPQELGLLPSNRQLNRLILVSFYSAMTTELVLAGLLCCDCVFCNSLVFYVSTFSFILWAVVLAFGALTLLVGWQKAHPACKN